MGILHRAGAASVTACSPAERRSLCLLASSVQKHFAWAGVPKKENLGSISRVRRKSLANGILKLAILNSYAHMGLMPVELCDATMIVLQHVITRRRSATASNAANIRT
jgi:hypothetical protein